MYFNENDLTHIETWREPQGKITAQLTAYKDLSGRYIYKCFIAGNTMYDTSVTALDKGQILELFSEKPEFQEKL